MALLMPSRDGRRALLLAALLASVAGCMLVDALVQDEPAFAFSHRLHVEEEGLECGDCHASWEDSDDPGMPLAAQCALCHADLDSEKPPTRQVASLFDGERFRAARASHLDDEIVFSHLAHATRGLDCSACHAEVATDEGALASRVDELRFTMDECLACHATAGGPELAECAACHREIRADAPPPSHRADWLRYHGNVARRSASGRLEQCSLCHAQDECTTCHQVRMPANHDNYWRRRGHGVVASMDRDRCETCHDTDSCQRCHDEVQPMSHVGAWGAPRDNHCLACHEPLRSQSCGVCHMATPSHEMATPLPPDHLPGMNCRLCHGNGQPLPHADNGQTCTSCHR